MIIYSMTPLSIQMTNTIVLEDEVDGGFVYVNKDTYDQARDIFARFDGDCGTIWKQMVGTFNKDAHKELFEVMQKWRKTVPEPLHVLMWAFINLQDTKGIKWDAISKEDMYGFMHELSMMMDLNAMTLVPAEVRARVKVPSSMLLAYKDSWDSIIGALKSKVILDETPTKPKTVTDMSPEEFAKILKDAMQLVKISAPPTIVKEVPMTRPVLIETPTPTVSVVSEPVSHVVPETKPINPETHIQAAKEKSEKEMEAGEKDPFKVNWDAIFADAKKKTDEKFKKDKPAAPTTSTASTASSNEAKHTINGNEIAKFDQNKANETKQIIDEFEDI